MRKTQLLDNNPNSIYGASKNLANVSFRNIMSNPVQNDAMSQNLNMTLPKTISKDTNVDGFLGKILDCDSYLQQMYLYVYADKYPYGNYGRYSYKDTGASNILERNDSGDDARGAGLSDDEDDEEGKKLDDNLNLTRSQLSKMTWQELKSYNNRIGTKMNNKSSDSEKTYKMTEEDYKSIGVNPLKINDREYFINSPLPKRKAPLAPLNPSPLDIMKASMNNSANRRVNEDFSYEDISYENPMRIKNSSKLISPIVRKGNSSILPTSTNNMSNDSLNRPREYYFYDSSNPGSIASSSNQKSIDSNSLNTDHLQIHPESSSSSSYSSGFTDASNGPPSSFNILDQQTDDADDDGSSSLSGFTDLSDEFKRMPIEANLIQEMSKFNTKINDLYVFFKGKIKPNLKTISKQDIQDILKDMNQLDYNFTDVLHMINDLDVFGFEDKNIRHKKIDAFKQTFETNFKKSSADIISSVKAYSSLGMYSTSSVPDNILFNSKFPTFDGKGLSFIPDSVRKNMHHSHKYLQ